MLADVEALAAALEQDAHEIDHCIGVAHRGIDRSRDGGGSPARHGSGPPGRPAAVEGRGRAAHRDADAIAALGRPTHHVAGRRKPEPPKTVTSVFR